MILKFKAKCSDRFCMSINDVELNTIVDYEGYVPENIRIGGGDYVEMYIDVETGKIIGWRPEMITAFISEYQEKINDI